MKSTFTPFAVLALTLMLVFGVVALRNGANLSSTANAQVADDPAAGYDFYEDFSDGIDDKRWLVATWNEHKTQMGKERCFVEDGVLNLVFINDSEKGFLGGALQTRKEDFSYGRWEARIKPSSVSGVLNSMYTIDWRDGKGTRQEIDIEFLTYTFDDKHPGEVWIAMHAKGRKSTGFSVPLEFNPSKDFHVWGFDITPTHIEFFVDDQAVHKYVYENEAITVDAPYMLKFNVWSLEKWINGPPKADTPAIYQIDWVRFKAHDPD